MKAWALCATKMEQPGTWNTTIWSGCNEHHSSHGERPPAAAQLFLAAGAAGSGRLSRVCRANPLAYSGRCLRPAAWSGAGWGFSDLLSHHDCRREEPRVDVHQDAPGFDGRDCRCEIRGQPFAGGAEYWRAAGSVGEWRGTRM